MSVPAAGRIGCEWATGGQPAPVSRRAAGEVWRVTINYHHLGSTRPRQAPAAAAVSIRPGRSGLGRPSLRVHSQPDGTDRPSEARSRVSDSREEEEEERTETDQRDGAAHSTDESPEEKAPPGDVWRASAWVHSQRKSRPFPRNFLENPAGEPRGSSNPLEVTGVLAPEADASMASKWAGQQPGWSIWGLLEKRDGDVSSLREEIEVRDEKIAALVRDLQKLQARDADIAAKVASLRGDLKQLEVREAELAALREDMKQLEERNRELAALRRQVGQQEGAQELIASLRTELDEVRAAAKANDELREELGEKDYMIQGLQEMVERLKAESTEQAEAGERADDLSERLAAQEEEVAGLRDQLKEVEAREKEDRASRRAEVEHLEAQVKAGEALRKEQVEKLEAAVTEAKALKRRMEDRDIEFAAVTAELELLEKRDDMNAGLRGELERLKARQAQENTELAEMEKQMQDRDEEIGLLRNELKELNKRDEEVAAMRAELSAGIEAAPPPPASLRNALRARESEADAVAKELKALNDLKAEMEPLREKLKQAEGRAEESDKIEKELKEVKVDAEALRARLEEVEGQSEKDQAGIRGRLEKVEAEKAEQAERMASVEAENTALQKDIEQLKADATDKAGKDEAAVAALQKKLEDAEADSATFREKAERLQEEVDKGTQVNDEDAEEKAKLLAAREEEVAALRGQLRRRVQRWPETEAESEEMAALREKVKQLEEKVRVQDQDKVTDGDEGGSETLMEQLQAAGKESALLRDRLEAREEEVASLQEELKVTQQKEGDTVADRADAERLKSVEKENANLKEQLAALEVKEGQVGALREDVKQLKDRDEKIATLKADLKQLKAEKEAMLGAAPVKADDGREEAAELRKAVKKESKAAKAAAKDLADAKTALRQAKLSAMVAQLGGTIRRELAFVKDLGSGAFADVVLAKTGIGSEVVVKLSLEKDSRALLVYESRNLQYLNSLPDSQDHVVELLEPYCQFEIELGASGHFTVGAVIVEKAECDLTNFVEGRLGPCRPDSPSGEGEGELESEDTSEASAAPTVVTSEGLKEVADAVAAWERSIEWLHSHGVLHLDIKAENAVCFPPVPSPSLQGGGSIGVVGPVKLIDVGGIVTREHIIGLKVTTPMDELVWDGADLQKLALPYVSTMEYAQPQELGPGPRFLDFSADWWSLGVSKIELLRVDPSLFDDEEKTGGLVLEALNSGSLAGTVKETVKAMLPADPSPESAADLWANSVVANLEGRRAPTSSR